MGSTSACRCSCRRLSNRSRQLSSSARTRGATTAPSLFDERSDDGARRDATHPEGHAWLDRGDQRHVPAPHASAGGGTRGRAIADPSYLNGRAAAVDILSGEQIVASDFARRVPSMTVLVATEPILKGTPGSTVVANGMYRATVPRPQQRQVGAISDPSYLMDRASVADIQLGQQLTEANFPARG